MSDVKISIRAPGEPREPRCGDIVTTPDSPHALPVAGVFMGTEGRAGETAVISRQGVQLRLPVSDLRVVGTVLVDDWLQRVHEAEKEAS